MLLKSSHYWKVICEEKSQPWQTMVKGRGKKKTPKKKIRNKGTGKQRVWRREEKVVMGGADLSVLSLNWLEMYREQKTNSTSRDFSDNPPSCAYSPPHMHTRGGGTWPFMASIQRNVTLGVFYFLPDSITTTKTHTHPPKILGPLALHIDIPGAGAFNSNSEI